MGMRRTRHELRKPGGLFATTWQALHRWLSPRRAELAYLRVLKIAASAGDGSSSARRPGWGWPQPSETLRSPGTRVAHGPNLPTYGFTRAIARVGSWGELASGQSVEAGT
jgi:hypothetical protein